MPISCTVCLTDNFDNTTFCQFCGSPLSLEENNSNSTISGLYLPPKTLLKQGNYQIEKTLGQGGFGITYKAIQMATLKELAIKELFPDGSYRQGTSIIWSSNITPKEQQKEIDNFKKESCLFIKMYSS